jgi:hypothetical protein
MNQQVPIITKVEFFDTSYEPMKATVSARNFRRLPIEKADEFLSHPRKPNLYPMRTPLHLYLRGAIILLKYLMAGK